MGNVLDGVASLSGRDPAPAIPPSPPPPPPPAAPRQSPLSTTRNASRTSFRRKRTRETTVEDEVEEISPRRKQIRTTSMYIYNTLFKKGVNSDVTIVAIGREWKLHKHYLCQSGYFNSMFNGNWRESRETRIDLDIPDPAITLEALDLAFSSLYHDLVTLPRASITSVIAAASMLQMDGLLEHCGEFMKETLSSETAVLYLSASSLYGLHDIQRECRLWLHLHLVKCDSITLLKEMSASLLTELIRSEDLCVLQVEMDVYTLAKRWLFLRLNPEWSKEFNKLLADADTFFKAKGREGGYFLESEEGKPYVEVFREIRLQHILNDPISIEALETDRVIPEKWLHSLCRDQWVRMLTMDQRLDPGPEGLSTEEFNALSFRCGRILLEAGEYCWRWTGFSFGFDVLVQYDTNPGLISIKRNTTTQPCVSAVSLQHKRALAIRLRVTSLDEGGRVCFQQDTGIVQLSFLKDEECPLLTLSRPAKFPQYIGVNMALTSASAELPQRSRDE